MSGTENNGRTKTRRILVLDDELITRSLISEVCRSLGFEVAVTITGSQAIEVFEKTKQSGVYFDLAILDLHLPDNIGGDEVFARIHSSPNAPKVIITSGDQNHPLIKDYEAHGVDAVLKKPFKVDRLTNVVTAMLGRKIDK